LEAAQAYEQPLPSGHVRKGLRQAFSKTSAKHQGTTKQTFTALPETKLGFVIAWFVLVVWVAGRLDMLGCMLAIWGISPAVGEMCGRRF
jgi:hypothetical protein